MSGKRPGRSAFERAESAIILSTLILLAVVCLQPIIHLAALSVSDPANVPFMTGIEIWPQGFDLDIWTFLLTHPSVGRGILNSVGITVVGTLINVVGTALMAWALSRQWLPGRRIIFLFVLATIVFEAGLIPDYFVNKKLGLLDTYWSVIFFGAVNAWYLIILIRFFEEIPEELVEAAQLDGAGAFRIFWSVVLPLALPALATISLFYLVFHWNEFFRSMIYLSDPDKRPLQVVLRQLVMGGKFGMVGGEAMNSYTGDGQINVRQLNAGMIILTILPILAIYPLILKFFTKGTLSGALKG